VDLDIQIRKTIKRLNIIYICIIIGHIICTFEESTNNKICIFQVPAIVEKIVLIKIKQLSVYLLMPFNNSHIPN
jgi:hypothetical protein